MIHHIKLPLPPLRRHRIGLRLSFSTVVGLCIVYIILLWGDTIRQLVVQNSLKTITLLHAKNYHTGDIIIQEQEISSIIDQASSFESLHHQVRMNIIKQMIQLGYTGRVAHPWTGDTNNRIVATSLTGYRIDRPVEHTDALDIYLDKVLKQYGSLALDPSQRLNSKVQELVIPLGVWSQRSDLHLIKQQGDIELLGYEIVSHRTRVNRDKEYRRFNIMTAFAKMGNVLVLNPGSQVNYLRDIHFDDGPRVNYRYGLSIIGNEEIQDYGGGICGSSTALYQGILTNMALNITKRHAHTRRYSDLYSAIINGQHVTTPGNDSALYGPSLDLIFMNKRSYPVIIVANYDGTLGGVEEVFSFARPHDRGSFEFISKKGSCYTWFINNETRTSCYNKVF